jgi:hypothetical protein
MFQKHLNQFVKQIQKKGLKNNILLFLLITSILSDTLGSRVSDFLFPYSDENYWTAFFCFQSLSSFLFASVLLYLYKVYFYKPLKKCVFRWVVESWFAICTGDLLDNLFGNRYETNIFDFLTLGCIASSLFNVLWIKFRNQKN